MLMAAVTSTSLGTDIVTARPATSEHTEEAGMSFAENFVESAALTPETPLTAAGPSEGTAGGKSGEFIVGKDSSDTISSASSAISGIKTAASISGEIQDGPEKVKSVSSGVALATGLIMKKSEPNVVVATLQHGGKPDGVEDLTPPSEMSDNGKISAATEIEDSHVRKTVHASPDESVLDGSDTTAVPDPEVPAVAPVLEHEVTLEIASKNEIAISNKSQSESSTGKVVKDHGAAVKTGKEAKAEDKQEKGVAVSGTGAEVQTAALAPAFVNSVTEQQSGSKAANDADALSSARSIAPTQGIEIASAANDKKNKASISAVKVDGNNIKTLGASPAESQLAQKTEADATKPGSIIANSIDDDRVKTQSSATSATDPGQTPSTAATFGPVSVVGGGLTHTISAALPTTAAVSHAVATVQAGPNSMDTSVPGETAPRTLLATPTSLEVGVSNGTHGWLKIRAEMADGGTVNTSLSPSSIAGQQMLHRELPSLAAYLKSEHVAVNAVVVQPMPANGSDTRDLFGGAGSGGQGQAQQGGSQMRQGQQNSAAHAPVVESALYSSTGIAGEDEVFPSTSPVYGGAWLSVRA